MEGIRKGFEKLGLKVFEGEDLKVFVQQFLQTGHTFFFIFIVVFILRKLGSNGGKEGGKYTHGFKPGCLPAEY